MKQSGWYAVNVTNRCGTGHAATTVTFGNCLLVFPDAFSPIGDGHNDFFRPGRSLNLLHYHLLIWDRWGRLVYQSENPMPGWDGRANGSPAAPGTYVWSCTITDADNSTTSKKGTVILIR